MKLKSLHIAVITLAVILGGILLTSMLGAWKTTNDKVPATFKDGEFAGKYNPADIRGSYTFDDIFNAFEVPVEDLGKAFGVQDPDRYVLFQCKELETLYAALAAEGKEVGTGSVRYFVALYTGLPMQVEEGTYLPDTAVAILEAKADLTKEQIEYIEKHAVTLPKNISPTTTAPAAPPQTASSERVIKGSTTFNELLDWGVKKEDIEKTINDKLPDTGKIIKDYATAKGIEFSELKDPLQKLVDALKNKP